MNRTGISLGWNCSSAQDGLRLGLRKTKGEGYKTCPFDMMVSNYIGMCKCIEDDFKYFCDPKYLELKPCPIMSGHIPNQVDDELWVYNTYYNFTFNHESPFHGKLYLNERWDGPYHFVNNNFDKFIERYERRINNFREYLKSGASIDFILWRYNSEPIELINILKTNHPNLDFKINLIVDFGPHTTDCLINRNENSSKEYEMDYLKYMGINEIEYPKEFKRYNSDYIGNTIINENIVIIEPKNNPHLK